MNAYKRIPFEHLHNCRDLGGYAGAEGKMIGYHRLYRCESPSKLMEQEWKLLNDMGVKTIIDLRSESEQEYESYIAPDFMERISYPLQEYEQKAPIPGKISKEELAEIASSSFGKSLADGYRKMIEDAPDRMVFLLETVEKRLDKGAVLYHCTAGKDRTGVLSAMIYFLCGVDDTDIIADYQVSATYQAKNPMFNLIPEEMRSFLSSDPETMEQFLQEAHAKDYLGLLKKHGLRQKTIETLKSKLME